ncbi:MAG TPA: carbamoyl-phosphate synthase large subunit, partial [Oscillospiraceae bacterium]|nr:carbamoyl-phosphate synthase large subunit [Oscillospiraceae bacterium]
FAFDDQRVFAVFEALRRGVTKERIFEITRIDPWFLSKIENLLHYEREIEGKPLSAEQYLRGKKLGYPDAALSRLSGAQLPAHRKAVYKMVDTCAAEFAAATPYFYSSYDDVCEARQVRDAETGGRERVVVLGSGPIRIGQGIEFDYSSVHCVWSLKKLGYEVIILNNNPETVSTDFDTADRLYFEPLTPEDLDNVLAVEKPVGVVVAFGGQTAIRLTKHLAEKGVNILGTSAEGIDIAEDRGRFDAVLEKFGIKRPRAMAVMTLPEALGAAEKLGFPVLLRPSYVIGGQNMTIAYTPDDVTRYMEMILEHEGALPVLIDQYLMGKELEVDVLSDGKDVLIPGIMEHIERAGIHSGDSIAIYPPQTIGDAMLETIVDSSTKLALSLGTKGLVNIQYLIYGGELYVIEVNPRASRTIPYVSKVTGVPMVDLAANIMVGRKLADLGYGTGLYRRPPYVAVKVPVFSFEKLSDVNSALGPEMKSTGEVLGIGKNLQEALFKGLLSAGFTLHTAAGSRRNGVLITVNKSDRFELVRLAKKLNDLGLHIYATEGTASAITPLDIDVTVVGKLFESDDMLRLLDEERLNYIVYTGKSDKASIADYIKLHRGALRHSVACLTSLDTANALADIIASRYREENTELVDLCRMRTERQRLRFTKMEGTGDDYIFFENFDGAITCPESLSISFCDRSYGIGGTGIVLIEHSDVADAKMRNFNRDGSEGQIAGNCLRCVGKYLHDKGIVKKDHMTIETASGVKKLRLYSFGSGVGAVEVEIGRPVFTPKKIPVLLKGREIVAKKLTVGGGEYLVTCLSVGNPHCVVFVDRVDGVDIERVGPLFENHPAFPERVNTEFVRVVNRKTIKMRTWERGNGETVACGTGACAAAVAAVKNGFCDGEGDITVKLRGGDLTVRIADGHIYLTGNA